MYIHPTIVWVVGLGVLAMGVFIVAEHFMTDAEPSSSGTNQ